MATGAPAALRAAFAAIAGAGLVAFAGAAELAGPFAVGADPHGYRIAFVGGLFASGLALYERRGSPPSSRRVVTAIALGTSILAAIAGGGFANQVEGLATFAPAVAFASAFLPVAVLALLVEEGEAPEEALDRLQREADDPAKRKAAIVEARAVYEEARRQARRIDATQTDRELAAQAAYVLAYALQAGTKSGGKCAKAAKQRAEALELLEATPRDWIAETQRQAFTKAKRSLAGDEGD